jgi:hypothetical protein
LEEVHLPSHKEKSFECNFCERHLNSAEKLKEHLTLHKEFNFLKTSPKKDQELLATVPVPKMVIPEDKNKCLPCRRIFPTEEDLEKHNQIHSYSAKVMDQYNTKMACKFCPCKMESLFWKAHHYSNSHSIMEVLKFKCAVCEISFGSLTDRTLHVCPKKVHEKTDNYAAEEPFET